MKKKRKKIDYSALARKKRINTNITDELVNELNNNIPSFSEIRWVVRSKRYTDSITHIKYELAVFITDAYYGHIREHNKDKRYITLYYLDLKKKLGRDYRKVILTCFDLIGGVKISSPFRKDGSTFKYKLKDDVLDVCNKVFSGEYKKHGLIGRDGTKVNELPSYVVSNINADGELSKKVDNKPHNWKNVVQLNENNVVLMTRMWADLYRYKTGRIKKKKDIEKWLDVLDLLKEDINDLTETKLRTYHKYSVELAGKTTIDIVGMGSFLQLYTEKDSGRLYGDGWLNLQTLPKLMRYIAMGGMDYYEYDMENAHYNILYQYNKMLKGPVLRNIKEYIKDTDGTRDKISRDVGVDVECVKKVLIPIIYGASMKRSWNTRGGVQNDSAILEKCLSYTDGDRTEAMELWNKFKRNSMVFGLTEDIKKSYKHIKKSWITTNRGKRLKNVRYKTINIYERNDKTGEMDEKSCGKLLSHLLQGIESVVLGYIILEEGEKSFVMPHHDGWVSRKNWDTDTLEQIIKAHTTKVMNDYSQILYGFDLKIKKLKLNNPIMGDWTDKLVKKGIDGILEQI
jgi:hypothetical protein|tara:strand:+ start:1219 stop:2925 length:1707 start_codon:yes stop_codon:yes gene_type:complete